MIGTLVIANANLQLERYGICTGMIGEIMKCYIGSYDVQFSNGAYIRKIDSSRINRYEYDESLHANRERAKTGARYRW